MAQLVQPQALQELRPGSQFLQALSRGPENFHRANISSYATPRWVLFRTAGDAVGTCAPMDQQQCNGEGFTNTAEQAYRTLLACSVVAPWMRPLPPLVQAARACGQVATALNQLDYTWRQATQGSDSNTDGVVPGASQHSNGRNGCIL